METLPWLLFALLPPEVEALKAKRRGGDTNFVLIRDDPPPAWRFQSQIQRQLSGGDVPSLLE